MSLLIKGMEMPESCYNCDFTNDGFYLCKAAHPYKPLENDCEERRPDWCPLVEVSDDGVVISEDEFRTYSRALLVAFTLRDLLDNLNGFTEVPKSIEPVANAPAGNEAEE